MTGLRVLTPVLTEIEEVWRGEAPHFLAALLRRGSVLEDCEDAEWPEMIRDVDASGHWPGMTVTNISEQTLKAPRSR